MKSGKPEYFLFIPLSLFFQSMTVILGKQASLTVGMMSVYNIALGLYPGRDIIAPVF